MCAPLILNFFFLKNSGEFLSVSEIFTLQNRGKTHETLYGSSLFNEVKELKLYSIKMKKPKIVAFGSSRVLQFRDTFFSEAFYNLGYTASSIHEALDTALSMLLIHKPKVVLLGIDFWWFNENFYKPNYDISIPKTTNNIDCAHLLLPFKWISEKSINFSDCAQLFQISQKEQLELWVNSNKPAWLLMVLTIIRTL